MLSAAFSNQFLTAAFVAAIVSGDVARAANDAATSLQHEYRVLSTQFAEVTPGWRPEPPVTGALVFVAPDQYAAAPKNDQRFRESRKKYADELFALAKRAAEAGELSLAFQWATEAVRENPNHADARRVLGYEQRDGKWLTAYAAQMADAGKHWDPVLGWVDDEEPPGGAATKHKWQVRADHFQITTDLNQEAAVELAARLERLYQVWRQLFAGFGHSDREVRELFAGERPARKRNRPFRVFLHENRDAYIAALVKRQPRIAETLGIYFDNDREAHFFAGDDQDAGTLYHEAVHQLFQESRPAARHVGGLANFWIVEGIATYFETLAEHDDPTAGPYFTIGEWTTGRLPAARERLADGFYVPLAQLVSWNKEDLQHQVDLAKIYSQSAGLSAFLMDGAGARYREPLVRYLAAVYAGRDDAESLAKLTSRSDSQLDAEYRQHVQSLP